MMKPFQCQFRVILMIIALSFLPAPAYAVKKGDIAPAFSVEDINSGQQISLEQFKGKLVYLDFWASWCPPCLKSFPFMEQLKQKYSERGLVVVAISLDQKREAAMGFLNRIETSFIIGHNSSGSVAKNYDVMAMPSSYLIDRDGKIILRHLGFNTRDGDKLDKVIQSAL